MKILQNLKSILPSTGAFPYEDEHQKQLELGIISMNYRSERVIAYCILTLQIIMILIFSLHPGNIFLSDRRLRYLITYIVLTIGLLIFLPLHKRFKENRLRHTQICTAFSILLALWIVSISYLDSLGNTSIVIYCSIMPIMAVFITIPPYILSIVFVLTCIATNICVLSTPYGHSNLFGTLINSIFICLLSVIYAYRVYQTRLNNEYNRTIIQQKNQQLEAANKVLERLSMTDALTSIGNRRYLEESVDTALNSYGIHMGSFAILFIDIDSFKQYNDRYSHQQGDVCLQTVASIITSLTNHSGFRAIRYGGEEFVLVLTGLSSDEVMERAEKLRRSVASKKIPDFFNGNNETSVTVSVGVSFYDTYKPDLLQTALSEADQALYQAKQSGKNKVVLYGGK